MPGLLPSSGLHERFKTRVSGWKLLPGISPVASVPGYSLCSLSLDYASPPIAFHLRFLHGSLPVCLLNRLQFGLCVWHVRIRVCSVFGGLVYENGGLGI